MSEQIKPYDPVEAMGVIKWTEDMKIEPGNLYMDMPNPLYHAGPGISKSGLDLIHRSPLHYQFMKANPKPSTPALVLGSALHSLVLEPDKFPLEFVAEPTARKPTSAQINAKKPSPATLELIAFWEKFEAENGDKVMISTKRSADKGPVWGASDWDTIHRMRDSVMNHPDASVLLSSGIPELAGYWVDTDKSLDEIDRESKFIKTAHGREKIADDPTYKLCKLKIDWYNHDHNVLIDLKTTNDASYSGFAHSVIEYRYFVQDAYYRHGMRYIGWPVDEFIFMAVEKEPPYAVAGYVLDSAAKQLGRSQFRRDLSIYLECKEKDYWQGYQDPDGRMIRDLQLPQYAFNNQRIF